MIDLVPFSVESLFLCGYVVCSILLNIVGLLISLFYKKNFNQPSPKAGFLIAIILALVCIVVFQLPLKNIPILQICSAILLFGSSIASIISILFLFLTMSKVRK